MGILTVGMLVDKMGEMLVADLAVQRESSKAFEMVVLWAVC